jgi:hypothetical protein
MSKHTVVPFWKFWKGKKEQISKISLLFLFYYGTIPPILEETPDETFIESGWCNLVPRPYSSGGSARSRAEFLLWSTATTQLSTRCSLPEIEDPQKGRLPCSLP